MPNPFCLSFGMQVPFSLMATAYRRKRLMEGIISGDKETMGQIVQLSERQAQVGSHALYILFFPADILNYSFQPMHPMKASPPSCREAQMHACCSCKCGWHVNDVE